MNEAQKYIVEAIASLRFAKRESAEPDVTNNRLQTAYLEAIANGVVAIALSMNDHINVEVQST